MSKKLVWAIIIVLVVLVVLVAVILILEKEKVKPNPIDVQCKFACDNNQRTAFCFVERTVNPELTKTCYDLSENPILEYYVEPCPAISCVVQDEGVDQTCITGLGGTWESPDAQGECPQSGITIIRQVTPSDESPISGQICCR